MLLLVSQPLNSSKTERKEERRERKEKGRINTTKATTTTTKRGTQREQKTAEILDVLIIYKSSYHGNSYHIAHPTWDTSMYCSEITVETTVHILSQNGRSQKEITNLGKLYAHLKGKLNNL